jgi:hypothetical protein
MGVDGKRHAPAALPPGMTRYPLCRRLGGTQRMQKIVTSPDFFFHFLLCCPSLLLTSRGSFTLIVLVCFVCLYCTTHTTQTSMPPAGFEPAIPASDRPQTFTEDRSATEIRKGFDPRAVEPVANCRTDRAIPALHCHRRMVYWHIRTICITVFPLLVPPFSVITIRC